MFLGTFDLVFDAGDIFRLLGSHFLGTQSVEGGHERFFDLHGPLGAGNGPAIYAPVQWREVISLTAVALKNV